MDKVTKVQIDSPHGPFDGLVDVIVPLPDVRGVQKLRIGHTGQILTEDIGVKGGFWIGIVDNTK